MLAAVPQLASKTKAERAARHGALQGTTTNVSNKPHVCDKAYGKLMSRFNALICARYV
jgi:hypothetical protein